MGVLKRSLVVEVVDARSLLPKDGHGTSSPYVVVDFYGQRKRTRTVTRDLNPVWNEVLEFNVGAPSNVFGDILEVDVYHDRSVGPTRRNNFLGRIRLNSVQFVKKGEEALMYFPLEKKYWLSWIQGEIGLKIYYVDEQVLPPPPPTPPPPPPPAEENAAKTDTPTVEDAAKTDTPVEGDPPAPAPEPPADGGGNPDEPVEASAAESAGPAPAEAAPVEEPAAPPPENVIETEKPPESEPPSEEPSEAPVDPPPPEPSAETEELPTWVPHPEVMASMASGSESEVKIAGFNGVRPISRQTTSESFTVDPTERIPNERCSYDLVEKMHYLFVRVVKARSLPTNGQPVVKISVSGSHVRSRTARKTNYFEWDQTFAFGRDTSDLATTMDISVWDPPSSSFQDPKSDNISAVHFLGGICFDVSEIPLRDPPDSPLAPQWYRLEGCGAHNGDLMLATWIGTQADESFSDAWKTDTAGNVSSRSKVYLSPKLWYLRSTVIEAQDSLPLTALKEANFQVKAQLGYQVQKTKVNVSRNGSPLWNEDLIFVAAEPFSDHLEFSLENRLSKGTVVLGVARIPLATIERRVDDRKVVSRWFSLEDPKNERKTYKGRVHLRLCFDGGYHVMDESTHVSSDFRPTARQLWKPPVGTVELGIVGCKNLLPMKTINGKGTTDAYSVAKYGQKWVRTRTVSDSLDPRWNEQYTWKVYDPCTVLTIGVFDSWGVYMIDGSKEATRPDFRIGKVRIRISTLQTGRVYRNSYPLILLSPTGVKKMGEIEIAVRFIRAVPTLDLLHVYTQTLLPPMHHIKPLGVHQQDLLRNTAAKIVAVHLSRSEPPLLREVVLYMLDADTHGFSMRKVRANWFRIINVIAGVVDVVRWIDDTRSWKNPTATLLVHALLVMLVWFPDLIVPTLAFYMFVIGAWNYRFRARDPLPHLDPKISQAEIVDREELDEEFDTVPSSRSPETVRARYDKLRTLGARVQTVLGDFATQGERVQALVTWRDPRATGIFVGLCFIVAVVLYLVPTKMVAMAMGFYYMRHPMFRDRMPSPALNFFRRLPSLTDRMM
ncbi:C2 calcium-dependent membrane targeting [Macleaya cordata]|uniref:C2 calcium-dependent membrane targeting n=1 Tax=Macleaya cordata TaxID=56857 RepID=A0A200QP97_MACCD|nr:C2 calcium-dependent membrane targeting [Macleaya cordata]